MEATQNATKHGGPGVHIGVTLRQDANQLAFDVEDDGAGFGPDEVNGTGFTNMHDRVGALGGRLTVRSVPGQGTTVSGHVPRSGRRHR
jgi:signal transduction histidine kinase